MPLPVRRHPPQNPPTVTSAQFPDGTDGWPENTSPVRTEGTFTIANGGVTDVAKYEYWTDWDPTVRAATPAALGGSKDVKLTPVSAGAHFLYARSIDRGGNTSDRVGYLFYVKSPNVKDEPGDLNGDGNSDLYGVRTDGGLWQYSGTGNGSLSIYSVASSTNFNNASITHRGDWTDAAYEDLIATNGTAGSETLQLYPNNGYGYACTTPGNRLTAAPAPQAARNSPSTTQPTTTGRTPTKSSPSATSTPWTSTATAPSTYPASPTSWSK